MVIIHRTIRRLKDIFQYTRPYDQIKSQQRIMGRRVLSTKKRLRLPLDHDSNYNTNFNEISLPTSLITKTYMTNDDRYDAQQKKFKIMLIDELKNFFISRNQNHQQQNNDINSETNIRSTLTEKSPIQQRKQIVQRPSDSKQTTTTKNKENTSLLPSISLVANNVFDLLTKTCFYSISFTFGYFGAPYIRQMKLSYIHCFDTILTRSLLFHTFLTLFTGNKGFTQRTSLTSFLYMRQDILLRIITSILHFTAGFMINFDSKDVL